VLLAMTALTRVAAMIEKRILIDLFGRLVDFSGVKGFRRFGVGFAEER